MLIWQNPLYLGTICGLERMGFDVAGYVKNWKRDVACAVLISTFACLQLHTASNAQSLEKNDVINKLAPEAKKPPTRGLTLGKAVPAEGSTSLSKSDAEYLGTLPKRGLSVRMKQQVAEIMDHSNLPSINIEIGFNYDSAEITPQSIPDLNTLGEALINPRLADARLLLNGHTDAVGSDEYNMDLSERRADAVRHYLISHFGISEHRLIAIGFGEERLKNRSHPDAAENRRVEVVNVSG
ncbi:OmpA family protein [Rhizobium sp. L1K21]|uniref:OmpA family protein n=1 Tax=Rhizobium sp. L1K21 TaxID=2954933 RepID=UPI00209338CA|nr:OmpA family protein [Rhizobium sp. L1K21]MCO6184649.1 OmpA family protein [Rhizobium sp. L1K21]